jgi:hypothetical protein
MVLFHEPRFFLAFHRVDTIVPNRDVRSIPSQYSHNPQRANRRGSYNSNLFASPLNAFRYRSKRSGPRHQTRSPRSKRSCMNRRTVFPSHSTAARLSRWNQSGGDYPGFPSDAIGEVDRHSRRLEPESEHHNRRSDMSGHHITGANAGLGFVWHGKCPSGKWCWLRSRLADLA